MLKGFKLLDLSRIIVGPYASMVLSDFGVDVIKIESLDGDPTRQWGPPWHKGTSAYFHSVNRNKRSLALNLKNSKHR
jgi:crotonobetainyl-CoA:carnitine CoA-transferase CaiB-like acyl-CoA transferase